MMTNTNRYLSPEEKDIIQMMRPEIHPHLINQGNRSIDADTDLGRIDLQYRNDPSLFIDLISAANFGPGREKLSVDQIYRVNEYIKDLARQGATLDDVLSELQGLDSGRRLHIHKPGKVLNTEEYPRVASVLKQGTRYSQPVVIDLAKANQLMSNTPLRNMKVSLGFNKKAPGSSAQAHRDTHESAWLLARDLNQFNEADITDQFFVV